MKSIQSHFADLDCAKVNPQLQRELKAPVFTNSGNTGESSYPHLHFFAQQLVDDCHDAQTKTANFALCPQIPVSFSNVSPSSAVLKEWVRYTALPN